MANDVKWIKFMVGTFDGESFKKIKRAKIGGESFRDKLTAVWFELMDLAGKSNHNGMLISGSELPYQNEEDIAIMLDRDVKEIELCMAFYVKENMVEIIDNIYRLSNWEKYQNIKGLEDIREQTRLRVAKFREKQKEIVCNDTCNTNVTLPSYSISNSNSNSNIYNIKEDNKKEYIKEKDIIIYLNEKAGTGYKIIESNLKFVRNRLKDYSVEEIKEVIDKKVIEWKGTTMEKYLRPETLFNPTKFESYRNQNNLLSTQGNKITVDGSGFKCY